MDGRWSWFSNFFVKIAIIFILLSIMSDHGVYCKKSFLKKQMAQILGIYSPIDSVQRIQGVMEMTTLVRMLVLGNMAGGYHDPKCKGTLIWSEPTLVNINETMFSFDLTELDRICLHGGGGMGNVSEINFNCSAYFYTLNRGAKNFDDDDGGGGEEAHHHDEGNDDEDEDDEQEGERHRPHKKIKIALDTAFQRAEIEFIESLQELVRLGISVTSASSNLRQRQQQHNDHHHHHDGDGHKRSFFEELQKNVHDHHLNVVMDDGNDRQKQTRERLLLIERRLICSFAIFEQIFSSIDEVIAQYIQQTDPYFNLNDYDPYQGDPLQPDVNFPFSGWSNKRSLIPTKKIPHKNFNKRSPSSSSHHHHSSHTHGNANDGVGGYHEGNCTVRGLFPIWGNLKCYTVKFLGDEFLMRMLYETSRTFTGDCGDDCSKKRKLNQDYDLNDFVAKFNYYHIYLSCSMQREKKLIYAASDLIPEAKGSVELSELRLSLDYMSDDFDRNFCNRANADHKNQIARSFLSEGKCRMGEISGGKWNELLLYTQFSFDLGYGNDTSGGDDNDNTQNRYHSQQQHINKIILGINNRGPDVLRDINFTPVTWKYCNNDGRNCSRDYITNCGEKCNVKEEYSHGGRRKFIETGIDELFNLGNYNHHHNNNNHHHHHQQHTGLHYDQKGGEKEEYLFNTINRNPYSKIKRYFTSFMSTHGDCGLDTDIVTPMYLLRNYQSMNKICCNENNCRDVTLIDFFGSLEEPTLPILDSHLPLSLVTKASDEWKYLSEGRDFYIKKDSSKNLIQGGEMTNCTKTGRPSLNSAVKYCHYRKVVNIKKKCSKRLGCEEGEWILSDQQCACNSECSDKNLSDSFLNEIHNDNNGGGRGGGEGGNNPKGVLESKCLPPLGYCINDIEEPHVLDAQINDPSFQRIVRGCDYWDECSSLFGSDYHCDTNFLDDNGIGFSFCAKRDGSKITSHACSLGKNKRQCKNSICTAGNEGCVNGFDKHIADCKNILLSSSGKIKCQFNLLKLDISSDNSNHNDQENENNNDNSSNYLESFRNCFYNLPK